MLQGHGPMTGGAVKSLLDCVFVMKYENAGMCGNADGLRVQRIKISTVCNCKVRHS